MKTNSIKASVSDSKKMISAKTKKFEADLMKAKNDFYIVLTLDEMILMLHKEVAAWVSIVANSADESEELDQDLIDHAAVHVGNMNAILDQIVVQRSMLIDNALKIQLAMLNSHQLKSPQIIREVESFGYGAQ